MKLSLKGEYLRRKMEELKAKQQERTGCLDLGYRVRGLLHKSMEGGWLPHPEKRDEKTKEIAWRFSGCLELEVRLKTKVPVTKSNPQINLFYYYIIRTTS